MSPDLKRALDTLQAQHGSTRTSKKHGTEFVAIHKTKRKEVLGLLIQTMQGKGKDRSYFEKNTTRDDIADYFFPDIEGGMTSSQRKGARIVVLKELDDCLAIVWPEPDVCTTPLKFQPPEADLPKHAPKTIVRDDLVEAPYKASETVVDEDFLKALEEAEDE